MPGLTVPAFEELRYVAINRVYIHPRQSMSLVVGFFGFCFYVVQKILSIKKMVLKQFYSTSICTVNESFTCFKKRDGN